MSGKIPVTQQPKAESHGEEMMGSVLHAMEKEK
jgi:hypothetical protein